MRRRGGVPLPKGQRKDVLVRLLKTVFSFYPVMLPITLVFILFNAIISSIPSVFMQNIIALVEQSWSTGDWASVAGQIGRLVGILVVLYVLSLAAGATYNQLMAIITQGSLAKMRKKMFNHMQDLPIRYFDTHNHGNVMSYYTNDIDTLRQMISQSMPNLLVSVVTVSASSASCCTTACGCPWWWPLACSLWCWWSRRLVASPPGTS